MLDEPLNVDEEITLKIPTLKDAAPLFQLVDANRHYLRKHLAWVDDTKSVSDTEAFIQTRREHATKGINLCLCIWYRKLIAGAVALTYIDQENRMAEIGYWLDEQLQGKGIITRSCQALIDHSFKTLGIHRLEIRCSINNPRSQHIAEKLGFIKEGILRDARQLRQHPVTDVLYSLLSTDPRAGKNP